MSDKLLLRRTQLAAKAEGTEGTAETLTNSERVDILVPDAGGFKGNIAVHERNVARASLSPLASVRGARDAVLDFIVELRGSGSAGVAPDWGPLIQACGFGETIVGGTSVTYLPISTAIPSITLAVYLDGVIKKLWGARGSFVLNFNVGQPGMIAFHFEGADFSVVDGALIGGTPSAIIPPVLLSAAFTIDSYAALIEAMDIDIQNEFAMRADINAGSGNLSSVIANRRPVGSVQIEEPKVATYDIDGKRRSANQGALTLTLGASAGNIIDIDAPKAAWSDLTGADREGIRQLDTTFELNQNAGDDELQIQLT
jgi:hypothetical protein